MRLTSFAVLLVVLINMTTTGNCQEFVVLPFLQQATPTSIWIVWETDDGNESRVDYGLTVSLGSTKNGAAIPNVGSSIIHQTKLTELIPGATYYYRVTTGDAVSGIRRFQTPDDPALELPFRFAAYSDSQIDGGNPNKHFEIINDGIISYVGNQYGGDIWNELDFVMIPGDLVSNGNTHSHWTNHFFGQAQNLYRHVPLYPVLGNHEVNSPLYFRYFNLPENGTPGFLEHWYYHDHGNVRIIGMDSNGAFQLQEQLDWLDSVLADACTNSQIDFVFAQLHHPHKSELWTPGETDYTGQVISRLEQFTTSCGKPSIHFFGHTHGYSRGQSRDHNHLWVNVASGGGNIDYWGEFANADYPEFQYTSPDYGFMIVEVESGNSPEFVMKRISRGNEVVPLNNELVDMVTIRLDNIPPDQPAGTGCSAHGHNVNPDAVVLEATPFNDPDDNGHLESHFQLATTSDGFDTPLDDVWLRFENWYSPPGATGQANGYFSVDTIADPDITKAHLGALDSNTQYFWRVRYRDKGMAWSQWSTPDSFSTGESSLGPNLLTNPGAEDGISGWTIVDPPLESLTDGQCGSGTSPINGTRFFAIGGVCSGEGVYGEAFQTFDVSDQATAIDAAAVSAVFGGYLKNYNGSDRPSVWLVFLDGAGTEISATPSLEGTTPVWTEKTSLVSVPESTRHVEFHMAGTRLAGNDNDSYLEDLNLRIGEMKNKDALKGDVNLDGAVNLLDVEPFVTLLGTGSFQAEADTNCDCQVNLLDVASFVELLGDNP